MRRGNHRKFGLETKERAALYRSLATALIEHGKIKTTAAKAKALARFVEHLLTLAKRRNLNTRRLLAAQIGAKAVKKLTDDLGLRFAGRQGGYTRIIRLGARKSDSAKMAIVEFTA